MHVAKSPAAASHRPQASPKFLPESPLRSREQTPSAFHPAKMMVPSRGLVPAVRSEAAPTNRLRTPERFALRPSANLPKTQWTFHLASTPIRHVSFAGPRGKSSAAFRHAPLLRRFHTHRS